MDKPNIYHVTNIQWDTDGGEVNFPAEVDIPASMLDDRYENPYIAVEDYLTSVYGFCHGGFCVD